MTILRNIPRIGKERGLIVSFSPLYYNKGQKNFPDIEGISPICLMGGFMNWDTLVKQALDAKEQAYVPYSHFHVGAAVLTASGKVFTGCNVENASYGATICAERTAIVKTVSEGETQITAIAITSDSEDLTFPCGICRQVIAEFGNSRTIIICSNKNGDYKEYSMADILPNAFTKEDLDRVETKRQDRERK